MTVPVYSAGIVSQSFWFIEFKKYLRLIQDGKPEEDIKTLIIKDNIFGAPNEYRARRMFGYLSSRVKTLCMEEIDLFFICDLASQKIINLISIAKTDFLLFEFLNEVYREHVIIGSDYLNLAEARVFMKRKEEQSEIIAAWADKTKRRMISNYFNFLTDAGLLTSVDKNRRITPPVIDMSLENYLKSSGEPAILKAITGVY